MIYDFRWLRPPSPQTAQPQLRPSAQHPTPQGNSPLWYVLLLWSYEFEEPSKRTISKSMCTIFRSKEAPASWPWLPMAASLPHWEHFSKPFLTTMDGATSQLNFRSSQLAKNLLLFCCNYFERPFRCLDIYDNIMISNHGCISLFVKTNICQP